LSTTEEAQGAAALAAFQTMGSTITIVVTTIDEKLWA
jgi:hypothetical protein